jgi:SAM-dependent methyltransferase
MDINNTDDIRQAVRKRYGQLAQSGDLCGCSFIETSCCGGPSTSTQNLSEAIGYSEEQIKSVPEGANMGLGCGNPIAHVSSMKGDTVLDLGSGAGFDCFLAAQAVGENGKVIGIDMTPEMVVKAQENARKGGFDNVEFRLGEIEKLPVADKSIDLILSNCVINLSPDKEKIFAEAFRVLKPGGKIMISDIVLLMPLPESLKNSLEAYVGCLAGATLKDEYLSAIKDAGLINVKVVEESFFATENILNDPNVLSIFKNTKLTREDIDNIGRSILSIRVFGEKPDQA